VNDHRIEITMNPSAEKVQAQLRNVQKQIGNMLPFHKQAAVLLDRWTQRNFKFQGGLLSDGKWAPFAHGGRLKQNEVTGQWTFDKTAKLLQDTGDLKKSHAPFFSERNAGIGSDLPYAKTHHLGQGLPTRRTLPNKGEMNDEILRLMDYHVRKAADAAR
jgi:phage gpG-like protein